MDETTATPPADAALADLLVKLDNSVTDALSVGHAETAEMCRQAASALRARAVPELIRYCCSCQSLGEVDPRQISCCPDAPGSVGYVSQQFACRLAREFESVRNGAFATGRESASAVAQPQPAPTFADIRDGWFPGRLLTLTSDPYPGLGEWFGQIWSADGSEVVARVYGDSHAQVADRISAILAERKQPAPEGMAIVPVELLDAIADLKDVYGRPSAARTRAQVWRDVDRFVKAAKVKPCVLQTFTHTEYGKAATGTRQA